MKVCSALAASGQSDPFSVNEKWAVLAFTGSLSSTTFNVECSPDDGANWFTYYTNDAAGAPAALSVTATQVPATTALWSCVVIGHGLKYRIKGDSTGSGTLTAYANGTHVK